MGMSVARLIAMGMSLLRHFDRHHRQAAVSNAALCDDMFGAMLNVACTALENHDFHAALVIQMDMQCRVSHVVMIMKCLDQTTGQIARRVVVDVNQGGDAITAFTEFLFCLLDSSPRQVPDRLRPVLVAPQLDYAVKINHEIVVESDGHSLHRESPLFGLRAMACWTHQLERSTWR
jgi:hypothetical protein